MRGEGQRPNHDRGEEAALLRTSAPKAPDRPDFRPDAAETMRLHLN